MKKVKQTAVCFLPFLLSVTVMYSFSLIAGIVLGIVVGMMSGGTDFATFYEESYNDMIIVTTAVMHVTYVVIFGLWYRQLVKGREEKPPKLKIKDLAILFLTGVIIQIAIGVALEWILPLFETIEAEYMMLLENLELGHNTLSFLVTVFVAPIGEELIFRGVTMELGKKCIPFWWLNVLQALLFGVYHMNIVQGAYAFLIGLVLGYVCKRYQSLKACIWLHLAINFAGNVLSLFSNM